MEPELPLRNSQESATGPYTKPDTSSAQPDMPLLQNPPMHGPSIRFPSSSDTLTNQKPNEYHTAEIPSTSEARCNECCYSDSSPHALYDQGPNFILHEMDPHLFLPEENAAPFSPLSWIPFICNPVKQQRLSSESRYTVRAQSHWQHTDFKCQILKEIQENNSC
jgi:hypothetical protein